MTGGAPRVLSRVFGFDVLACDGAHEVLTAFVPYITCTPFGVAHGRGYDFAGDGDYGALVGQTLARRGVPDGICPSGARFVVEGRAAA